MLKIRQRKASLSALLLAGCLVASARGVAAPGDDEREMFLRGSELLEPYLFISDVSRKNPKTADGQREIAEGIAELRRVTQLNPNHWPAFWMMGKGYQAIYDHAAAYTAFGEAYRINPRHVDVARELILEAVCVGQARDAVPIAERTLEMRPNDAGLMGNLGFALLAAGDLDRAKSITEQAIEIAPGDRVTQNLKREIEVVSNGSHSFSAARYCGTK